MKEEEWWLPKEDISELEEDGGVDESDLKQVPGIDREMEKRLKEQGYETLWEVAFEDYDVLAVAAGITQDAAEKIISITKWLLGMKEDEEDDWREEEAE
jgi:hypothetical protein